MMYRFWWNVWLAYSTSWYYNGLQLRLFINGTQYNITVKDWDTSVKGWDYYGTTGWYKVSNKTSGSVPFYAKLYDTGTATTKTTSSTYYLTVSGATSEISVDGFDVDAGATVAITKYNTSFTDNLNVYFGDTVVKTVAGIENGANVSFDESELAIVYNLMKSVQSGEFTFAVTTDDSGTTLGTNTATAIGRISGANPTLDESGVSYADTNNAVKQITGNPLLIVQNQSKLTVYFGEATGHKGASISRYVLSINGVTQTKASTGSSSGLPSFYSVEFGEINSAQDQVLTVTAEDSRGNTTTVEKTVSILAWSLPTFSASVERLNNYEDETYVTVNANISYVDGKNKPTITYRFKHGGGDFGDAIKIENYQKHTTSCDKNFVYTFSITVADLFGSVTKEFILPKGKFPLFIDTEKAAVGINEFPSEGEALHVAGGVALFEDGIVLCAGAKKFKITINDSGSLVIEKLN